MTALFITILNMSVTASVVALAVMLVRIPLKKSPKVFSYALWGIVLFRLVCPLSIESGFSFMPTPTAVIPQDIVYSQNPAVKTGMQFIDAPINTAISNAFPPTNQINTGSSDIDINQDDHSSAIHENYTPADSQNNAPVNPGNDVSPIHTFISIAGYVWLSVFAALLLYAMIGYIRLKRRVYFATRVRDNIYESDKISTPFVLGLIHPKIYIPIGIDPLGQSCILDHEQTHIRRRDYIIKPLAFAVFAMHWFNPVIWVAYFLMSKDIEMSCDEAVLRKAGGDIRGEYGKILLDLSVKNGRPLLSPLAFGESGVKARVKNVMNFKAPSRVIIAVALTLVIAFSAGFAINRIDIEPIIGDILMDNNEPASTPQTNGTHPDQQEQEQVQEQGQGQNQGQGQGQGQGQEHEQGQGYASQPQYGNTSGNISNGGFTAQDGDSIYYVLFTNPEEMIGYGELIKSNADGSERTVLLSGGRPHSLNIVDGWIYYINSDSGSGHIYKMRVDGTENTLITSSNDSLGLYQGYATQNNIGHILRIVVVDDWIYCRVNDGINVIYRINTDSGEVERLQEVGPYMAGLIVHDGWIYYSTVASEEDEPATYKTRTDGTENTKIADALIPNPSITNDRIFYISGYDGSGPQIYGMDLDGANNGRITDSVLPVRINAVGDWIYFADTEAIYKVKTDGTELIKLCDYPNSSFIDINVVNDWIYLQDGATGMHMLRTDGSGFQEVVQ